MGAVILVDVEDDTVVALLVLAGLTTIPANATRLHASMAPARPTFTSRCRFCARCRRQTLFRRTRCGYST
jgi:hypothetical protein